jgi:hypothetical protein
MTRIRIAQIQGIPNPTSSAPGSVLQHIGNEEFGWAVNSSPKSVTLTDPLPNENLTLFYTESEVTLRKLVSHIGGLSDPSVTFSVRFGANRATNGTEVVPGGIVCANTALGLEVNQLPNALIPASSWVWLTTSEVSGVVSLFHLTLVF